MLLSDFLFMNINRSEQYIKIRQYDKLKTLKYKGYYRIKKHPDQKEGR